MKAFGFLSFGHHAIAGQQGPNARQVLQDQLEIAKAADDIGVNNASFRVHHFAPQGAAPMPMLGAVVGATKHIEVGTGVIDMRYENPLYLAEEAAALDLLANGRTALGVSRGSPEPADQGWESFGYSGQAPNGADMAREKFETFLHAIDGYGMAKAAPAAQQYPRLYQDGAPLPIFPHSPGLHSRIFWGSGSNDSAVQAAQDGVNLMSSTLVSEADGRSLGEVQRSQIDTYRQAWKEAGHERTNPRVSVSRSIFPIIDEETRHYFQLQATEEDQIGSLGEGRNVTFGRTYADEPDKLIEQLKADPAIAAADTLLITIPNTMGVDVNVKILQGFAEHVAPALGWIPNTQGVVEGYDIADFI
ncbi:LLM class flavin-dependent oxidoreductase [Corynebacterium cystitidis]|uniref:Flavin-dependent oxidoreductase, luciferase family (Includes alkanesulfonate monooxygenase SsuD and methylene tetrahydromethanopterin reductase) n=1 Tax=Corynebacterium cystitidis DSM 20524 TaxID=1121357 RepID=A0A1H9T5B6_9CORY|nr:LLM class flavin-dependent oxidoreductase [Corynebacterium cystitidis]WJY83450.1 Alkanal monooxygenase alpha chain [Corynebacterium cystitidis DSM 20524]SER91939.1 Flavin-dependent oxidoreductase, luciferase family (includes alkanesulfonate monooxygenase SsuD and methylene tetrahydromethanopterin reductase) [Corynebacterium cystitidis DSM 20524]SNV61373.1 monooxygenase [Corynebacterium cystitidis]